MKDDNIEQMIEVKSSATELNKAHLFFEKKYHLSGIQLVRNLGHEYQQGRIQILKLENDLN